MDYTEEELLKLIARHDDHEDFYRAKLAELTFHRMAVQIATEVLLSIEKHGDQRHLPMGTGPETFPLETMRGVGFLLDDVQASRLADAATRDTKAHSRNEGGDGTVTWWHILREEVFEAAAEDDPAKLRAELIQVAAVALKMIDALDHQTRGAS